MKKINIWSAAMLGLFTSSYASAEVCLYQHHNYGGAEYCTDEATANTPPGWNNYVSSVRVSEGFEVTLYENANSDGAPLILTEDTASLVPLGFNDVASSFSVVNYNKVCLYEHVDYDGEFTCFAEGEFELSGFWNNQSSSARVPGGMHIALYTSAEGSGNKLDLSENDPNFVNSGFNDVVSSVKVTKNNPNAVCFFEHLDFGGNTFCGGVGEFNAPAGWDNYVTSIKVEPGYIVDLFSLSDLNGGQLSYDADVANLVNHQFNDQMSSFRIRRDDNTGGCVTAQCEIEADVTAVNITNPQNQAPQKGDDLKITLTVKNTTNNQGIVQLTPHLTSTRFTDYSDVTLPSVDVTLNALEQKQIVVNVGRFILDLNTQKRFATGRGGYTINRIEVVDSAGDSVNDTTYNGKSFNIAASNAVLTAVVYDQRYLDKINYTQGADAYLKSVFTRPGELYTPGNNNYQYFANGFDQMMNVRHMFDTTAGFVASPGSGLGFCEQGVADITEKLGLAKDWGGGRVYTDVDHHGFDYAIAMTPELSGGVACGWINIQISGLFNFDLSMERSQILAVHETGHLFGAPHCDPIQGYVMCSGEKNDHYKQNDIYVWHEVSRNAMTNRFD